MARFERVVAVSFAFPETILSPLIPAGLEIDSYKGLGFVTVALVWTSKLRPSGFPALLGRDFFLAGYRIFSRLQDHRGRRLRGLNILRSETDKRLMVWLGNMMTGYRYRHVNVLIQKAGQETRVATHLDDGNLTLDLSFESPEGFMELPDGSPFGDWQTARRFAGPMPYTFSAAANGSFVAVEGSRQHWMPRPILVRQWKVSLFDSPPLEGTKPILANAFAVEGVSYRWKKGRIVTPGRIS